MPKKARSETYQGRFFKWKVRQEPGRMIFGDARSNSINGGRHSLGTHEWDEALKLLAQLDLERAVHFGIAPPSILEATDKSVVALERGSELYLAHAQRAKIAGGVSKNTVKRYRAPLDKFVPFCYTLGVRFWNVVTRRTLEAYAAWLDDEGYAYGTEYFELTQMKSVIKWLVDEKYLPATCLIHMPLTKPGGTTTYAYTEKEVSTMQTWCDTRADLIWLGDVIFVLTRTGLRIRELAELRWTDFDFAARMLRLPDASRQGTKVQREKARTTKSHRTRELPLTDEMIARLMNIERSADGRVFHGPLGGLLKPDTVRNVLIREVLTPLAERFPSQPDEKGFVDGRLHSFRHFFCSMCAIRGVSEQTLMRWLGHADSKMVKRYFHLHDDVSHQEMRKLTWSKKGSAEAS